MFEEKKIEQNNTNNNADKQNLSKNSEKNNEKYDKIMLDSLMISSYNLTKDKNFLNCSVTNFENSLADSEYKILNFTNKTKNNNSNRQNISEYIQGLKRLTDAEDLLPKSKKEENERNIPNTPERILDAPNLIDDYYLNLLDWSVDNVVSVGLGKKNKKFIYFLLFFS